MKTAFILAAALMALPAIARDSSPPPPSPGELVAGAAADEWVTILPDDLLVMDLAPDARGPRRVFIQLIAPPYSQPWTANVRTLAKAGWWDGLAIVRSQDNYVVQWGDPDAEDAGKAKALPKGMHATTEQGYVRQLDAVAMLIDPCGDRSHVPATWLCDAYAPGATFRSGWPIATDGVREWPVHCYGTVGVGRGMSPDAGTGAELYAVIGHAPRHLDRNIAVVGRVIEGMEHLSTLPRGTEALGFYATPAERTPIVSMRLASELPAADRPRFEYLSTEVITFARYADARANRRDPFFIAPAGGADVCNIPVPVRRAP
ncbi:peptidylprolyl isomerase [Altererythrobacter aerius]|uniref:peptidylprolyl isomerase n=1 Tax=Tsuneonella aeria TaxID=1837929 RepID=A0A6I4TDJ2_9SPHN|nr:peptidylprolyl isomerase [Tsuneonella aeria]MXO74686.1 peptidylprolyl isomerase [Tsuneonella aeria]